MQRFITIATILVWLVLLYYGYIYIVHKTMGSTPDIDIENPRVPLGTPEDQAATEKERKEKSQREKALEMRQQQKDLMEQRQRSLRYQQNR